MAIIAALPLTACSSSDAKAWPTGKVGVVEGAQTTIVLDCRTDRLGDLHAVALGVADEDMVSGGGAPCSREADS